MGIRLSVPGLAALSVCRPWKRRSYIGFAALGVAAPLLCGCGPKRLRADFVGFESAYAETSNREMLLNLARLENHDPTFFFKIGQIASQYKMQAQVTGQGNYAGVSSNTLPTGGGTPLLNYENDPQFTFIPVNDQENAQFLIQPVPPETFEALYQQGWRVDQLFRLMVDRIELTKSIGKNSCAVQTYRNVPPQEGAPADIYNQELSQYVAFLRVAAILYELQKTGHLILGPRQQFVPFDENSGLLETPAPAVGDKAHADDTSSSGSHGRGSDSDSNKPATAADVVNAINKLTGKGSSSDSDSKPSKVISAGDVINAMNKNAVWELQDGKWMLGQKVPDAVFYLNVYTEPGSSTSAAAEMNDEINKIKADLLKFDTGQLQSNKGVLVDNVIYTLSHGFSISPPSTKTVGPCPVATDGISSRLVLRSMLGIMTAAAQEQRAFDAILNSSQTVQPIAEAGEGAAAQLTAGTGTFRQNVPGIELQPLLRLTLDGQKKMGPAVIRITYQNKRYEIADEADATGPNQYWNRDVFRLVSQLSAQVTVDISKFPLPTVLQLNTQ